LTRKKIKSIGPFRYISKKDKDKPFENELFSTNEVDLPFMLTQNVGNTHVLVYDHQSQILAFIAFQDEGSTFHIDLVESNRSLSNDIKPGTKLIKFVESLSLGFKYKKISLLSISARIPFYESLGYSKVGKMFNDPVYGPVIKMSKKL